MKNFGRLSTSVPDDLDSVPPGIMLAAVLSTLDTDALSGYDQVIVLRAHKRMAAHYEAQAYRSMLAMTAALDGMREDSDDMMWAPEAAAAEIRAALRLTRRGADAELAYALDLQERLPRVWRALSAGWIDVRRARILAEGTSHVKDRIARDIVDRIIERAPQLTTGQLRAKLRELCIDVDPDDASRRYENAVADRRVVAEPTVEGTANLLGMHLPPDRVQAAMDRINGLANSLRAAGECRTMDQLRADVLLDLLDGTENTDARRGTVHITVDLATLGELADHPGDLAGYGPVVADIARQVAGEGDGAEWRYTISDPETGLPVAGGITRRRPTARQRRIVETRDRTCVFPGCRVPAVNCDLDHTIEWASGGATDPCNLAPGCPHDHTCRHRFKWTYEPIGRGDYLWTTRFGHRYTTSGRPP